MSSFEDTRHVVQGSTGGSNDDTTAYNDVLASGSTLTFTSINGDQKSVSVTGGAGGSVQAFNNATLNTTTNEVTFSSTTGNAAHEVVLDLDPMLTPLETTVGGHTTDINDFKSREQFKNVTQHPDATDAQIGALTHENIPLIVNGRTYNFSHSSHNHTLANSVLGAFPLALLQLKIERLKLLSVCCCRDSSFECVGRHLALCSLSLPDLLFVLHIFFEHARHRHLLGPTQNNKMSLMCCVLVHVPISSFDSHIAHFPR